MSDGGDLDVHDEVEIEDFTYNPEEEKFTYPCPCGDIFVFTKEDLINGEDIARCPSCSLIVRVVYDYTDISKYLQTPKKQATIALASSTPM